jgi:hypothetical protein
MGLVMDISSLMQLDLSAVLQWLAGAGGAYLAVEVRIRWLRSDFEKLEERVERLEQRRV